MTKAYLKNVALVGAAGNSGRYMAAALLKTGRHTVTAITRHNSKATFADGIRTVCVDYDDHGSLAQALFGQDALVITLSGFAPEYQQAKLIKAAAEANVLWILPNEWSPDSDSQALLQDLAMLWEPKKEARALIEKLDKSSWISVTTGFWYEWSLAIPFAYGFDIPNRTVTLYDGGNTPMTTSTWPQVGRAVAALLSLPISSPTPDGPSLEQFRNSHVYIESFTLTQNQMLDSVMRVTNTQKQDWKITHDAADAAHKAGWEQVQAGDRSGVGKWLYGRVFSLDGVGNHAKTKSLANEALKLPKEDVDECTKAAVERADSGNLFGS